MVVSRSTLTRALWLPVAAALLFGCVAARSGDVISTIAGAGGETKDNGDGGPALAASLLYPSCLGVTSNGNLCIATQGRVRLVTAPIPPGVINTIAGGGSSTADNVAATTAALDAPTGLAVGQTTGDIYVASASVVRRLRWDAASNGYLILTVAGGGAQTRDTLKEGILAVGNPAATNNMGDLLGAYLVITGIAVDPAERFLYIACNAAVRRVDLQTGRIYTVAGITALPKAATTPPDAPAGTLDVNTAYNQTGFAGDGGPANAAKLSGASGMAFDAAGNLLVADTGNSRIRRIAAAGGAIDPATSVISTVAGSDASTLGDGAAATAAGLPSPTAVALDPAGNIFIVSGYRLRRVDAASGNISTIAGTGVQGLYGDGGLATNAMISATTGLAYDATAGCVYIDARPFCRVQRVGPPISGLATTDSDGDGFPDTVETLAGSSPSDATSTPFGGKAGTRVAMDRAYRTKITINLKTPAKSQIQMLNMLSDAAIANLSGKVIVDLAGVAKLLQADGKNSAKAADRSAWLRLSQRKQDWNGTLTSFSFLSLNMRADFSGPASLNLTPFQSASYGSAGPRAVPVAIYVIDTATIYWTCDQVTVNAWRTSSGTLKALKVK